jgi:ribosomal 50S subunit-recycling heat shock protein
LRLDVFLKRVGLIKQRTLAKQICDRGSVRVDGKKAKAGKEIGVGRTIEVRLRDEQIELRVADMPTRSYKRNVGEAFYDILKHERSDPLS